MRAAQPLAFRFRIPQSGRDAFDDQAALQFGHGSDDGKYHASGWRRCIEATRKYCKKLLKIVTPEKDAIKVAVLGNLALRGVERLIPLVQEVIEKYEQD